MTLSQIEQMLAEQGMTLNITRKSVKNINFRVKPNQLNVSAPRRVSQRELVASIFTRLAWAMDAHAQLQAKQQKQPDVQHLNLADGSVVKLWGEDYQLQVTQAQKPQVDVNKASQIIKLQVPDKHSDSLHAALTQVYRQELAEVMPALFEKWQPVVGKCATETRIKKMTTRWGSCNVQKARVWLSLYLAQYPLPCTEYVIVHELCHLHEANHSKRFWAHVARAMPEYKQWHNHLKGKDI